MERTGTLVIGGGIAGLAAAYRLRCADKDAVCIDDHTQPGGVIRTEHHDGHTLERGPFNVLVRHREFTALLASLGDKVEMLTADHAAGTRFVVHKGRLAPVPASPGAFLRSGLLSHADKARVLRGALYSRPNKDPDETLDEAAKRRFGRAFAQRIVGAMAVGIFAAEAAELGARAALPRIAPHDGAVKSPAFAAVRAMYAKRRTRSYRAENVKEPRGLVSFKGGLAALPCALAGSIGDAWRPGVRAMRIRRESDGYEVGTSGGTIRCLRVLLATPLTHTAALFNDFCPPAAETLKRVPMSSLVALHLGFNETQIEHPLDGYGFLVPPTETGTPVLGCIFVDSAFPGHAPRGRRLLRVFLGGTRDPHAINRSQDQLVQTALGVLRPLIGTRGAPSLARTARWKNAVPVFAPGHARVIEHAIDALGNNNPPVLLGSYTDGAGVSDCVRRGWAAAERIIERTP